MSGGKNGKYVIGVDFGTDSVRAVIISTDDGDEVASHVALYKRWGRGMYCSPVENRFRQHPADYLEGLEESVTHALGGVSKEVRESVIGIGVDTTGSTPAPVDRDGTLLALRDEFSDNPNAMFVLWKDHTAVEEADEINKAARSWGGTDFTKYSGGVYSSEWFWAKILHVLRTDKKVGKEAFSWVEHADWIPAVLTGDTDPLKIKRSRCAAGHKAMWHAEWGGLPSEEYLVKVDPLLGGLRERLYEETATADVNAGGLCDEWAGRLGLSPGIAVAAGAFDAHMGAVGAEVKERTFVMILGTSACDMAVVSPGILGNRLVDGICGQVDGSIVPGMIGLEAGQSSFGDVYAWFKDVLLWPARKMMDRESAARIEEKIVDELSKEAAKVDRGESVPVALDWLNGRRTPYADQKLKGAIIGLRLGTDAPVMFRSFVESTAYGAKAIIDRFAEDGVEFEEVVASGGIPKKSPFVIQVLSDVLGIPVKVARSDQSVALGAAMFAAVASGVYGRVEDAQARMGSGFIKTHNPDKARSDRYRELYRRYRNIGAALEDELRK